MQVVRKDVISQKKITTGAKRKAKVIGNHVSISRKIKITISHRTETVCPGINCDNCEEYSWTKMWQEGVEEVETNWKIIWKVRAQQVGLVRVADGMPYSQTKSTGTQESGM